MLKDPLSYEFADAIAAQLEAMQALIMQQIPERDRSSPHGKKVEAAIQTLVGVTGARILGTHEKDRNELWTQYERQLADIKSAEQKRFLPENSAALVEIAATMATGNEIVSAQDKIAQFANATRTIPR